MKIVSSDEMRELEILSDGLGIDADTLMERAGLKIAKVAWNEMLGSLVPTVLVLVGPGNNGRDGLVAARHLSGWGCTVTAFLTSTRSHVDEKLESARNMGVTIIESTTEAWLTNLTQSLREASLVVDAVLGTGHNRELSGVLLTTFKELRLERSKRPELILMAVDLPTGLDADTGDLDVAAAPADLTVSLGCPKQGLFKFPGAYAVGRLLIADIGIPQALLDESNLELVASRWIRYVLPSRPLQANKGTFGKVLVVAGSPTYIGAAYLASMGVLRAGAGYVTLVTPPSIKSILAMKLTEVTYPVLTDSPSGEFPPETQDVIKHEAQGCNALLLGCGIGQHPTTASLVTNLLLSSIPLGAPIVLDADALNILSSATNWWEHLTSPTVITPHPGEMSRLLGCTVQEVEKDRVETARYAANRWAVTVLLKGAFTVIASPDGRVRVLPFANPALATAGTGDVLAGVVASLLSQGLEPFDAASAGAFLHAATGDFIARAMGTSGAIASDLLPLLPVAATSIRAGEFTGGVEEV